MNRTCSLIRYAIVTIAAIVLLPSSARAYDFMLDGIYYELAGDHAVVTNNGQTNCYSGDVVIPATVTREGITYPVTVIGKNAFMLSTNLTHVTIPGTVMSIDNNAFAKCANLAGIELPRSVKRIGTYAFTMCDNLTHVTIPDSVTSIDQFAFYGCTALKTLSIGKSVTYIGENAFGVCYQMSTLIWNAKRCSSTGTLVTTNIDSVAVGNEVELIPNNFIKSSRVTHVTLPNSVTSIGNEAFFDCAYLTSINIPDSVTVIRDYTFYRCTSLNNITFGNSLKTVGVCAFENCSALTSVILPNSVTTIEEYAFEGCGRLASVTIGSGVTNIGYLIFYGCSQLTNVTCLAATPPALSNAGLFNNMNYYAHATLHVLPTSVQAYLAADHWKNFSQILGDVADDIPGDVNGDGEVNISDANTVIVIIINGGSHGHTRAPGNEGEENGVDDDDFDCDVNGDGEVNIADLNAVINYILKD